MASGISIVRNFFPECAALLPGYDRYAICVTASGWTVIICFLYDNKQERAVRQVIIYRGDNEQWVAECPSLPGCISQGKTRERALDKIKEAIEGYELALRDDGLPVPTDSLDAMLVAV